MTTTALLSLYADDPFINILAQPLRDRSKTDPARIQVKGITGSLDAVLAATLSKQVAGDHLFVLTDKEEASYFFGVLLLHRCKKVFGDGRGFVFARALSENEARE